MAYKKRDLAERVFGNVCWGFLLFFGGIDDNQFIWNADFFKCE